MNASVENIEREAEWYGRVLGFKVFSRSEANPDFRNWHLVIPGYRIDLVKWKGSSRAPEGASVYLRQGWTHVVFHVPEVAVAVKELEALHVEAQVNRDPKGVPIQLLIRRSVRGCGRAPGGRRRARSGLRHRRGGARASRPGRRLRVRGRRPAAGASARGRCTPRRDRSSRPGARSPDRRAARARRSPRQRRRLRGLSPRA